MLALRYLRAFALVSAISVVLCPFIARGQSGDAAYQQVTAFESYIHAKCKEVVEKGKTTDRLTKNDLADLPVGIARQIGNGTYVIAIDSAYRADRGGWFFSAYASITFPGTTKPIAFAAKNIGFNKGGLTSSSNIKLLLATTQRVPVNESLTIELPADGHNFIEFNCDGFKSVNLKGNFIFSEGLLIPDTEVAAGAKNVTASFEINTGDLNNIMTTVNITPFQISGLKDLSFAVKNAVVDYSDIVNPAGFAIPQHYQQTYGDDINLWRGFYLQDVDIRIKGFTDSTSVGKDPTVSAQNLLIDDLGVSGLFSATNLLSLQNGSADGWPFSVDAFSVKLLFNQVTGGSLAGFLSIPMLGEEPIAYTAQVEQENKQLSYRFSVATNADKEFPTPFSAKIRIEKGSVIALEKKGNGKLIPSALLHGAIVVENGKMKADKLRFENLGLTSQKPYIISGEFSTVGNGQAKSVGFPIRIDSVNLRVAQGQAALGFAVSLNFMNKEDKGFGASTFVQLMAKMEERPSTDGSESKRQRWEFDKVRINDIALDCRTQAFTLNGKLSIFNDDPTYGDGFHGSLQFSIKKILERGVKVNAYFGSKDAYRYWHVDAFVPTGNIPVVPPVSINGFMGGASYHMVRKQPLVPDFSKLTPENAGNLSTGSSEDHLVYLPDEKAGLGFLAGVTLVVANERAINADVMLEVVFNVGGGIKYVQFDGSAFFFAPINARGRVSGGKVPAAPVFASMSMLYDNDNDVFHSNLKTYVNLAGVIQGVGPNGLVGEAVIHVDRKDWYIYIGRPSQMFGISVAGLATAQTYFMIGTKIENLPLPPPEVREIFGDIDLSLMRDDLASAGGKGFATGVHFKVGFDSGKKLRPFYIVIAVGAGTDIMLRNYGNAQCAGRDGRIGIDGWYASGQAYVFLKGAVGIRVKKRNFDIVSLGLAALLQAKLPNPTWMKGQVAGRYSVLGGLVKGKFHLKFTVGEECEIINPGGEIDDIVVIADIKPDNAATEVSVFTAPQVSFNTAVETEFTMMDLQDNLNSYRIKLDDFSLYNGSSKLNGNITWNTAKDVAVIKTAEILPQNSSMKVSVKIHWEKKSSGGIWEAMKDDAGQVIYETKEATFTTGAAPNFIPEENVTFSYPIKHQYNFHVNESTNGYVKLNYGQAYLFESADPSQQWEFIGRFKDSKGKITDVPIRYDVADAMVNFAFPSALEKQMVYKLSFIKRPKASGAVDQNLQRDSQQREGGDGNEVSVTSNTLEGTIKQNVEKDIYTTAFRSSQYATFAEKWNATNMNGGQDIMDVASGNIAVIGKRTTTTESFDEFELYGKENVQPLVQVMASAESPWLKNTISPLLYDLYPYDKDIAIEWRDPADLGVKPLRGVELTNSVTDFRLTDAEISSGSAPSKTGTVLVGYYLSYYAYWDYSELLNKAAGKYLNNWSGRPEGVKRLLAASGYTDLVTGQYPVDLKYTLPGTNKVTYSTQLQIKF